MSTDHAQGRRHRYETHLSFSVSSLISSEKEKRTECEVPDKETGRATGGKEISIIPMDFLRLCNTQLGL